MAIENRSFDDVERKTNKKQHRKEQNGKTSCSSFTISFYYSKTSLLRHLKLMSTRLVHINIVVIVITRCRCILLLLLLELLHLFVILLMVQVHLEGSLRHVFFVARCTGWCIVAVRRLIRLAIRWAGGVICPSPSAGNSFVTHKSNIATQSNLFTYLARRFWNHVLTCRSLRLSSMASLRLSSGERYLWFEKRRSKFCVCWGVNLTCPPFRFEPHGGMR